MQQSWHPMLGCLAFLKGESGAFSTNQSCVLVGRHSFTGTHAAGSQSHRQVLTSQNGPFNSQHIVWDHEVCVMHMGVSGQRPKTAHAHNSLATPLTAVTAIRLTFAGVFGAPGRLGTHSSGSLLSYSVSSKTSNASICSTAKSPAVV